MNWEHLPKNAVDSETIEQAIIRIVAQHNNDNTAHMATGQSIDVHRKNDILDHKAGSVLNDKLSLTEFDYFTTFEDLDKFYKTAGVVKGFYNSCYIPAPASIGSSNYIYNEYSHTGSIVDFNKDILFEVVINTAWTDEHNKHIIALGSESGQRLYGFGFEIINGNLYGGVRIENEESEMEEYLIDCGNVAGLQGIKMRLQYIAGEQKLYTFVNGINTGSLSYSRSFSPILEEFLFYAAVFKGHSGTGGLNIFSYFWSVSV